MKNIQPNTPSTFCHGRWFINVAAAAAAAVAAVFHHIYFICVFRLIIFLDLFFHYFIIFSYCRRSFHTCLPFMCSGFGVLCKDSFHIFYSLVLDFYAHTIRSRHSIFHAAYVRRFLKCDMCVNLA